MIMTEEQKKKAVSEYRKIKRREVKSRIDELKKNNAELFKMWAYDKSLDEKILKKGARENLIELEKLEEKYDKIAAEPVTEEQIRNMK